jgi:hypothetical protein
MPQSKKNKQKGGRMPKNKANLHSYPVNAGSVIYTGPSIMPTSITPETDRRELHFEVPATSTAGGVIDGNFTSASGTTGVRQSSVQFTSWQFREYRVLALRVEYHPSYQNCNPLVAAGTNALCSTFWSYIDRNDASPSGSYANFIDNSSNRVHSLMVPWVREAKMNEVGESMFISISADFTQYYTIKYFATGLSASTTYGNFYVRWIVEYRTRD